MKPEGALLHNKIVYVPEDQHHCTSTCSSFQILQSAVHLCLVVVALGLEHMHNSKSTQLKYRKTMENLSPGYDSNRCLVVYPIKNLWYQVYKMAKRSPIVSNRVNSPQCPPSKPKQTCCLKTVRPLLFQCLAKNLSSQVIESNLKS